MKYIKKPIPTEAVQWNKASDLPSIVKSYQSKPDHVCEQCGSIFHQHGYIDTLEGEHIVCPSDWIMTGIKGEHYPIKDNIFKDSYDLVSDIKKVIIIWEMVPERVYIYEIMMSELMLEKIKVCHGHYVNSGSNSPELDTSLDYLSTMLDNAKPKYTSDDPKELIVEGPCVIIHSGFIL